MTNCSRYTTPCPIIDSREKNSLIVLTDRYNKMLEPSTLAKVGERISEVLPDQLKDIGESVKSVISEQELYAGAIEVIGDGFNTVQELAAKYTISEKVIVAQINKATQDNEITSIEEICLARGYDISKLINKQKDQNKLAALVEGGATGYLGFAGLPFNLVLSTLMYYCAV